MPLHPLIRSLAQDGRWTLRDAESLKSAVDAGQVSRAEAQSVLERFAEAIDPAAAQFLSDTFQMAPRARLAGFFEGMTNQTLKRGQQGDSVQVLQRALMTVGLSSQNPAMALASGADGIFGGDTAASVLAFQKANGLRETGVADPATLRALQQALAGAASTAPRATPTPVPAPTPTPVRPTTGLRRQEELPAGNPGSNPAAQPDLNTAARAGGPEATAPTTKTGPATPAAMVAAAQELATGKRAKDYGTVNPWVNVDPRHAAPVDRPIGGLKDRWKCNLFGGNAMAAAGFEPPYYGNRARGGEYPVAESWQNWSTPSAELRARQTAEGQPVVNYAARSRNESRFDLMDEVRPLRIEDPAARERRVEEFLARIQPGDVVTVDHPGAAGSDGGHVRVCVGRDEQGRPLFAQALTERAEVVAETASSFIDREGIYILRPNTPRRPAPAPAPTPTTR